MATSPSPFELSPAERLAQSKSEVMTRGDFSTVHQARVVVNAMSARTARLFVERAIENGAPLRSFSCEFETRSVEWTQALDLMDSLPDLMGSDALDQGPGTYAIETLCIEHPKPDASCSRKFLWVSVAGLLEPTETPGLWAYDFINESLALREVIHARCEARDLNQTLSSAPRSKRAPL